jgi:hypothetical protein
MAACTDLYNSLIAFYAATPVNHVASATATLSIQHIGTGEVEVISGPLILDQTKTFFSFHGAEVVVVGSQATPSGASVYVKIQPDGTVSWGTGKRARHFLGNCTIDPSYWIGKLSQLPHLPGVSDEACGMLSVGGKQYIFNIQ